MRISRVSKEAEKKKKQANTVGNGVKDVYNAERLEGWPSGLWRLT